MVDGRLSTPVCDREGRSWTVIGCGAACSASERGRHRQVAGEVLEGGEVELVVGAALRAGLPVTSLDVV